MLDLISLPLWLLISPLIFLYFFRGWSRGRGEIIHFAADQHPLFNTISHELLCGTLVPEFKVKNVENFA